MSHQFFISYSRKDLSHLEKVKKELIKANLDIWTDEYLEPGTPIWQKKIVEALKESSAFILLVSPNSNNSHWVNEEITIARKLDLEIFCLWIWGDNEIESFPLGLFNNQNIDLRANYGDGIKLLITTVNKKYPTKVTPKKTPRSQIATAHIFISYARDSIQIMQKVKAYLINNGIKVWTDEGIMAGTSAWTSEIEKALSNSAATVAIISPGSNMSEWFLRELTYAESLQKRIYPLMASEQNQHVPLFLVTMQYISINGNFFEPGMQSLVKVIYTNHPEVIGD